MTEIKRTSCESLPNRPEGHRRSSHLEGGWASEVVSGYGKKRGRNSGHGDWGEPETSADAGPEVNDTSATPAWGHVANPVPF
jgi:hypothetical protein